MLTSTFRSALPRTATRAFSTTPRASSSFAKMQILGRLGTTPEEREIGTTGKKIVTFVVATDQTRGEDSKTSWFRVGSWVEGPSRDHLLNLPKGTLLHVEADANMNTYTADNGEKRSALQLTARNFTVVKRPYNPQEQQDVPVEGDEGIVH